MSHIYRYCTAVIVFGRLSSKFPKTHEMLRRDYAKRFNAKSLKSDWLSDAMTAKTISGIRNGCNQDWSSSLCPAILIVFVYFFNFSTSLPDGQFINHKVIIYNSSCWNTFCHFFLTHLQSATQPQNVQKMKLLKTFIL